MSGPAYYTGTINIALNEDWVVPFVFGYTDDSGFHAINLTGSTLKLQIRKNDSDNEALAWVDSNGNGIVITDAVNGLFTITMTRAQLAHLSPGTFVSDMIRIMPSGLDERLWEGIVTVVQGTTR